MLGVMANTVAVLVGSCIGLVCKKGFSKKISEAVMLGIGICTIYIGVSGSLKGNHTMVIIVSIVLGAILGTGIDIDKRLTGLSELVEKRISSDKGDCLDKKGTIAEGFVTASLLFCVGAMTLVGSLNAGLFGDNEMLFTKSVLDFISSIMLSASLGIGVLFSAVFVFVFQGGIALFAGVLGPILTDSAVCDMTCVGSLLIIGLGLNLVGATRLKVANYLPALLFSPIMTNLFQWLHIK